jgi:hypothetical protein
MKKIIFILILTLAICGVLNNAWAFCDVTVNLNVSTDPNAATQEVYYDPDNTVGSDEILKCSGDMTLTQCLFTISNPTSNDEVYVITKNATGDESYESSHVAVGGIAGSSITTVITNCTP